MLCKSTWVVTVFMSSLHLFCPAAEGTKLESGAKKAKTDLPCMKRMRVVALVKGEEETIERFINVHHKIDKIEARSIIINKLASQLNIDRRLLEICSIVQDSGIQEKEKNLGELLQEQKGLLQDLYLSYDHGPEDLALVQQKKITISKNHEDIKRRLNKLISTLCNKKSEYKQQVTSLKKMDSIIGNLSQDYQLFKGVDSLKAEEYIQDMDLLLLKLNGE